MSDKNKNSPVLGWLISIDILLVGFCSLCFNILNKDAVFGESTIYVQAFMPILLDLLATASIVVFICKFKNLAEKFRYLICLILIVILSVCFSFIGMDYQKDIADKPQTISSCYYFYNNNKLVIYDGSNGDEIYLTVNDNEQKTQLIQNKSIVNEYKQLRVSNHIIVYGMEKIITVEYYPNTKIVKNVEFTE